MPAHRKKGMDTFCFCSRYILYKKGNSWSFDMDLLQNPKDIFQSDEQFHSALENRPH